MLRHDFCRCSESSHKAKLNFKVNPFGYFRLCLYGGFLYDTNSCCGNSKQAIITSLFDLYTELIM